MSRVAPVSSHAATVTTARTAERQEWADNLKVVLVAGVIVAHATMAWTGVGNWVLTEPKLREPMLTLMTVPMVVGSLFGMALFFMIAGLFTPASVQRKGARRFCIDRAIRLGLPIIFFVIAISPFVEYADSDNAGYSGSFWKFTVDIWWPPAPGPTWFLWVLLVFSVGYVAYRAVRPAPPIRDAPPRLGPFIAVGAALAVTTFVLRLAVPLGEEWMRISVSQAPAWIAGFGIGAVCAERGWLPAFAERARPIRRTAWLAAGGVVVVTGAASAVGADIDDFSGGFRWQPAVVAVFEATLALTMSLWIIDLFRRRFNHQGPLMRRMSRSAFAAFVVHQPILVGLIVADRHMPWPREIAFPMVSAAAVAASFAIGAAIASLPGVRRVI